MEDLDSMVADFVMRSGLNNNTPEFREQIEFVFVSGMMRSFLYLNEVGANLNEAEAVRALDKFDAELLKKLNLKD